jgi:hypothetical protein
MATRIPYEQMVHFTRWPLERSRALPGQIRGNSLRNWGIHVRNKFGASAADAVRAKLGLSEVALPDAPSKKHWVPIHAQIHLIQIVIDDYLGGDAAAFEHVFEDTSGAAEKAIVLAGRMAGPAMVLRMAGSYHGSVCDVGTCTPTVDGKTATLLFAGAEAFDDPTWRFGQVVGMKTMFTTLKRTLTRLEAEELGPQRFAIHMAWTG